MNRRVFVMSGAATLAANGAPSDRITLGVIGVGGRGTFVMGEFQKQENVHVGAVCDVYQPNLEKASGIAAKVQGSAPRSYRQYRELLADKGIDAVLIATPEHWHHRMVLDALAAGKDVYVEKPLCQTPEQGVELVEAEKHSKNIVQVGMQRRSYDLYIDARSYVPKLGNVRMVRSWWLNNYVGAHPVTKLDGELDWDQWLGPGPKIPFNPDVFRNWRGYSQFSGGIVADQGAHVFDGIHMLMDAHYPAAVNASGGRPHRAGFDTPESVVAIAEYPDDFLGVFSVNYAAMHYKSHNDQLNSLDGDAARMDIGREDFKIYNQGAEDTPAVERASATGFGQATTVHVRNFLECIRDRKRPTAPMAIAFQAALVVQMANLSMKHGRRLRWNAAAKEVEFG